MELTEKLLNELQRRLKIGNRRSVHLNAIPANSRYKFDLNRLAHINKDLPTQFITALLNDKPLKFRVSWKENVPDLNSLFEEDQTQLVRIIKSFENLINQTEAIESEKGINTFGFGFPLLVRRDKADNKLTVAPILIWSLRIKRTKEFNTWEINRNEEDSIYLNEVLINHLQIDANVEIAPIPSEMLEDGLIGEAELIHICKKLLSDINTTSTADLQKVFEDKIKNISSIGDKAHYEKLPLNSTTSFIEFAGLFSIFEVQKQNVINDYVNLMELQGLHINLEDMNGHTFQPISSIETDPSQQSILHSLEATRNILIQGPPGTGKSQTLTAVLINALENNKKTIVVCEKRTALEVLHKSLVEKGLDHHCILIRDIVKDRKSVVDSVRDRIDNSDYKQNIYSSPKETLNRVTEKAHALVANINKKHQKIANQILGDKNWTHLVGELLKERKTGLKESEVDFQVSFDFTPEELNKLLDIIDQGQKHFNAYEPNSGNTFLNPLNFTGQNPYLIEDKIHKDFAKYAQALVQLNSLIEKCKMQYIQIRKTELDVQFKKVETCIVQISLKEDEFVPMRETIKKTFYDYRFEELDAQVSELKRTFEIIDAILRRNANNPTLIDDEKVKSIGYKFLSLLSKSKRQVILDYKELNTWFNLLEQNISSFKDIPKIRFEGSLESKLNVLKSFRSRFDDVKSNFQSRIQAEFSHLKVDSILTGDNISDAIQNINVFIINMDDRDGLKTVMQKIVHVVKEYVSDMEVLFENLDTTIRVSKDIQINCSFGKSYPWNKTLIYQTKEQIERIHEGFDRRVENEFLQLNLLKADIPQNPSVLLLQNFVNNLNAEIDKDGWFSINVGEKDLNKLIKEVEGMLQKKENYFKENDLFTAEFRWFQFYNSLPETNKVVIDSLKPKTNWRKVFLTYYLNAALTKSANLDLPTNDDEHIELDNALKGVEKEQIKFINNFWFSKQINSAKVFEQKNINLSVTNLYNKKSSKNYNRLSLRQIVQFDADLFTNFFPVILTTPDVASNLFKGMNGYFDIVMFDEASQLRLEDNLPAILKGKQVVIAGDEHQMPPSNYFSKIFDGTVEDEDDVEEEEIKVDRNNILLSCESLLDFASELNFQKRYLDFHYRSKHPYLIDFSNYAFYNQRLKPLPNTFDYLPIKYIQVNGTFSEHTNDAEAEMVLSIIEKNINRLPNGQYPTVGIATFNIAQRNLIKSKILERQKFSKFEEFNSKILELEENGLFIKNLENIQGDERDVIILSTTYGIGKDGKFAQRFGPINHSKGYKLLNVIITRAKFKVYVCTSVPEQVFMSYKDFLVTEGSNNKKAVFYAYLAYSKAVSDGSLDLRTAVLTHLAENTSKSTSFDVYKGSELESPFEEEVYQYLADHFGTDNLIPQLQFAGFRIDIVYDYKLTGIPKVAIECDGAKYHTSREAYLYDRHRQKILENHGFVFHRIWSTNWWRNPEREAKKLIDFIKQVETKSINYVDHSKTSVAFTDDVHILEEYVHNNSFSNSEKNNEAILIIESTSSELSKLDRKEVKLNSKVKVKYINNGKDIDIHLVSEKGKLGNKKGMQEVYHKSPLGHSLMGHTIGDIVKIGDLDNYVEILSVGN